MRQRGGSEEAASCAASVLSMDADVFGPRRPFAGWGACGALGRDKTRRGAGGWRVGQVVYLPCARAGEGSVAAGRVRRQDAKGGVRRHAQRGERSHRGWVWGACAWGFWPRTKERVARRESRARVVSWVWALGGLWRLEGLGLAWGLGLVAGDWYSVQDGYKSYWLIYNTRFTI